MDSEVMVMGDNTLQVRETSSATDIAQIREVQEAQGQIYLAKKFPRDEFEAIERINRACQRKSLAEQAVYSYPRGGQKVSGPSIRLAEAIAREWGNLTYGITELSKGNGRSELEAFAWDMEKNVRVTKKFTVEHKRDTKQGKKTLTDDRDIYEATANFGARRMRACILEVIPGDVVDMAVAECKKTMIEEGSKRPMHERLSQMLDVFKKDFKVTQEMLEEYCGRPFGSFGNEEIFTLQGVYKSLKDGQASPEAYFPKLRKEIVEISQSELKAKKSDKPIESVDPNSVIANVVGE